MPMVSFQLHNSRSDLRLNGNPDLQHSSGGFLTVPRRCFICGSVLLFLFGICYAVFFVHCSLVVTSERANLLDILCVMFYFIFVTFYMLCLGSGVVLDCIDS